ASPAHAYAQAGRMSELVDFHRHRSQALGKPDTLFQRLFDFFMVERVGRTVDEPLAVGDRHPTPGLQQLDDASLTTLRASRFALRANGARVREEFFGDAAFLRAPERMYGRLAALRDQDLVAQSKFLHLYRIVGKR